MPKDIRYLKLSLIHISTDSEIPDTTYYTATINTTRYATMVTDDNTYYADATGKMESPLLTSGTESNYTLKKVGYNDVTGTILSLIHI